MKTFFANNSVWLLMLFGILGTGSVLFAQENCRVLKPEINGTYTGIPNRNRFTNFKLLFLSV